MILIQIESSSMWADIFSEGDNSADEAFMAWGFAAYVRTLAEKASKSFPCPCTPMRGSALKRPVTSRAPTRAAAPTVSMLGVWRPAAPAVDFLFPEI